MNNPKLDNLTRQLQQTRMTEPEKTELREKLLTIMSENPAVAKSKRGNFWILRHRSLSFGLTLALVLIVTISSVSYAAEFSLPGEVLYTLKVNLTEPLRGSLKTKAQDQAEWNNTLVERRLTEAQILADNGTLTGKTETEILQRLTLQTAKARSSVEQISTGDTLAAAELNARLEATLQVNQELLVARNKKYKEITSSFGEKLHESLDTQASSTRALSSKLETDWQKNGDEQDLAEHTAELRQRLQTEQTKLAQPKTIRNQKNKDNQEVGRKLQQAQDLLDAPRITATTTPNNQSSLRQLQQAVKLEHEAQLLDQSRSSVRKNNNEVKSKTNERKGADDNTERLKTSD